MFSRVNSICNTITSRVVGNSMRACSSCGETKNECASSPHNFANFSVNEVEDHGRIAGKFWRLSVCERSFSGVAPLTQEVGYVIVMGCVVECHGVCPCVVHCLWTSSGQSTTTGWCCFGRVLAPPFWPSIEYIKCTALAASPLPWTQLNGRPCMLLMGLFALLHPSR